MSATRRGVLRALDEVPAFGDRNNNGAGWHRYLDDLDREPGFRKALMPEAAFQRMLADLDGGANPWRAIAIRAGLHGVPYASAVRADPGAVAAERKAREARLAARVKEAQARLAMGDSQAALRKLKEESDAATAAIEARDQALPRPAFLANPPLVLDDAPFTRARSPAACRSCAPSSRRRCSPPCSWPSTSATWRPPIASCCPLLITAMDGVGVTTHEGEVLDYAATSDWLSASIAGLSASFSGNPATRRMELYWSATASSPEEIDRAVAWLESFLLRPRLDPSTRERLVDSRAPAGAGRSQHLPGARGELDHVGGLGPRLPGSPGLPGGHGPVHVALPARPPALAPRGRDRRGPRAAHAGARRDRGRREDGRPPRRRPAARRGQGRARRAAALRARPPARRDLAGRPRAPRAGDPRRSRRCRPARPSRGCAAC